jgi:hypothetical protein
MANTRLLNGFAGLAADTSASVPDDLRGSRRPADAIDLHGTLARR